MLLAKNLLWASSWLSWFYTLVLFCLNFDYWLGMFYVTKTKRKKKKKKKQKPYYSSLKCVINEIKQKIYY